MGSVANLVMRKNSTLTDEDMLHLERHGRAVEESGGRLEVLSTFRGPALQNFMRDGASSRALVGILALDRAVARLAGPATTKRRRVGVFPIVLPLGVYNACFLDPRVILILVTSG